MIVIKFEPSEFVKRANYLKSKQFLHKPQHDKDDDHRKKQNLADNNSGDEDELDVSKLKLKICEIADIEYKKSRRMFYPNKGVISQIKGSQCI